MVSGLLYGVLAVAVTTAGALTGMGGGVILKPLLDLFGHFDVASINALSSLTVLSMAITSVVRSVCKKAPIQIRIAIPLAIGGTLGGVWGNHLLKLLIAGSGADARVFVIQNIALAVIIIGVYVMMRNKSRLTTLHITGMLPSALVGLFLGVVSSFLGIGGGPINVAVILFVFSLDTKKAALYSLVIILFSQTARLGSMLLVEDLKALNLSALPYMVVGAAVGGLLGSRLQSRLPDEAIDNLFNAVQIVVFLICVLNVIQYR